MSSVIRSAIFGGLLAILTLFLFLHNVRTTTIISLSIPLSLMTALAAMKLSGMTLNIMTLGGLTVAIGMIVDSSIVVLENIYRHYRETGDKKAASMIGAQEMGGAVTASTVTSLAVFLPLLFLQGLVGEILRDVSLTMAFSLLASLGAAVIVVPYLASIILKPHPRPGEAPPRLERIFSFMGRFLDWLSEKYAAVLEQALKNRGYVVYMSLVLLAVSLLLTRFLGFEFIPSTDMNEIIVECEYPPAYTLEDSRIKTTQVEELIYTLVPEVKTSAFTIAGGGLIATNQAANIARGSLQLIRTVDRKRSARELINLLQDELPRRIPDLNVTVTNGGFDEMLDVVVGGNGMVIELFGSDRDKLMAAVEQVSGIIAADPNVKKVDLSVRQSGSDLVIDMNHRLLGLLGANAVEAALTNRLAFTGLNAGTMELEGSSRDITLGTAYVEKKVDSNILSKLRLKNPMGNSPLTLSKVFAGTRKAFSSLGRKAWRKEKKFFPSRIFEVENSAILTPLSSLYIRKRNCAKSSLEPFPIRVLYFRAVAVSLATRGLFCPVPVRWRVVPASAYGGLM